MEDALPDLAALRALAERLVPADAGLGAPGAGDRAIFAEIEAELRPNLPLMPQLAAALAPLTLDGIAEAPLDQLLAQVQAREPAAFIVFAMAVMQGYYRDDRVLRSLGMEARAPFPKGYELAEGDLSLLEPVRARGPIWRETK